MKITQFVCVAAVLFFSAVLITAQSQVVRRHSLYKIFEDDCGCVGLSCGCCQSVLLEPTVNGTLCLNTTLLREDFGVSLTVTYNDVAVFNETVSARNPPPVCIGDTIVNVLDFCIRVRNIHISDGKLYVCFEFEVGLHNVIPRFGKLELGCIHVNTRLNGDKKKGTTMLEDVENELQQLPKILGM